MVFYEETKDKKDVKLISEKEMYYIFAMLGGLRQFCTHDYDSVRNWLYSLDTMLNDDAKAVLDKYYDKSISILNKDFVKNSSKKDFRMIFNALNVSDIELKKNISVNYYKFVCQKTFKNIGFSIKKIREYLLENPEFRKLKEKDYDFARSKLYKLIDFIIYLHYKDDKYKKDDKVKIAEIVKKLRTAPDDFSKDEVYKSEAFKLSQNLKSAIESVKKDIESIKTGTQLCLGLDTEEELKSKVSEIQLKTNASYFTKFMYLICLLIDGKEINNLLTTLIHQFENIASFIEVMKEEKMDCTFVDRYSFFNSAKNTAYELRIVNSFAKMSGFKENEKSTRFIMFREAADILGTNFTDDELTNHLNLNKTRLDKNNEADTRLRNFIISNVIKSSRFKYLIRYANPKKVKDISKNEKLVSFVLDKIPPGQIERYCKTCGLKIGTQEENIKLLTKAITNFDLSNLKNVDQRANIEGTDALSVDKSQKQGLISLYLTVLYLFVKNMVYVNSRYVIAFHSLERDSQLLNIKSGYKNTNYTNLTTHFVDKKLLNPHASNYLKKNIENSDQWSISVFRNYVVHLNAVRNINTCLTGLRAFKSYFEIYAYAIQKSIKNEYDSSFARKVIKINPETKKYFELLEKYGSYSKDFTKALNTPFGYCLARYKNLSIEPLFDKNTRYEKKVVAKEFQMTAQ